MFDKFHSGNGGYGYELPLPGGDELGSEGVYFPGIDTLVIAEDIDSASRSSTRYNDCLFIQPDTIDQSLGAIPTVEISRIEKWLDEMALRTVPPLGERLVDVDLGEWMVVTRVGRYSLTNSHTD